MARPPLDVPTLQKRLGAKLQAAKVELDKVIAGGGDAHLHVVVGDGQVSVCLEMRSGSCLTYTPTGQLVWTSTAGRRSRAR